MTSRPPAACRHQQPADTSPKLDSWGPFQPIAFDSLDTRKGSDDAWLPFIMIVSHIDTHADSLWETTFPPSSLAAFQILTPDNLKQVRIWDILIINHSEGQFWGRHSHQF